MADDKFSVVLVLNENANEGAFQADYLRDAGYDALVVQRHMDAVELLDSRSDIGCVVADVDADGTPPRQILGYVDALNGLDGRGISMVYCNDPLPKGLNRDNLMRSVEESGLAFELLEKPYTPEKLLEAVEKSLKKSPSQEVPD